MSDRINQQELFARPRDVVRAHLIVEEELGSDFDVDYTSLPKSVGAMGDSGVRARSVVISTNKPESLRNFIDTSNGECLDRVMRRICNETGAACRVLLDITPDDRYFEVDR